MPYLATSALNVQEPLENKEKGGKIIEAGEGPASIHSKECLAMLVNTNIHKRFWSKVDIRTENECWPWLGSTDWRYGKFWTGKRHEKAHRIAYTLVHNPPEELCVLHKCDNPLCVNPNHLFLGTQKENVSDRVKKGRSARGSQHGSAKLAEQDILEMRTLRENGWGIQQLAEKFGIHNSQVSRICSNKRWKHV